MAGKNAVDDVRRDLFGDPWTPPRDPRGRKRHRRAPEVAEKIAVLRAAGLTEEQIALRVGLSEPTLRKYYFRELQHGSTLARAVIIEAMYDEAKGGKVSAANFIKGEFDKGDAAVPLARAPKPKAEEPEGKKAAAATAAKTAHEGNEWASLLTH